MIDPDRLAAAERLRHALDLVAAARESAAIGSGTPSRAGACRHRRNGAALVGLLRIEPRSRIELTKLAWPVD